MNEAIALARRVPPLRLLLRPLALIWRQRALLKRMTWREISSRYRESVLGSVWAAINPLLMLGIYTFVFGFIMKSRWPGQGDNKLLFSLTLFAGLIVNTLFAETVNRCTTVIAENANYVKKVVFPLEMLPLVVLGSALFHAAVSLAILVVANAFVGTGLHWSMLLLPVVIVPILLTSAGVGWILASLGVFLRDASQIVGFLTALLMFLSPIFYPITVFPQQVRNLLFLNPLTLPVLEVRQVAIEGLSPHWTSVLTAYGIGLLVAAIGLWFFERTRRGFADVL
ncbi:MAG TPA: ABC transporter permease [Rhodanobacteraceae bacterium]|nr:ABC transporter permease [Rhodanobacteraceae bacterium]